MIFVEFEKSIYTVNERTKHIEICLLSSGENINPVFVDVQPQERVPALARVPASARGKDHLH